MLLDHNQLDHARRAFEAIVHAEPSNLDGVSGLAMTLERQGELETAHALLAPVIPTCPVHARMALVWGAVCRRLGRAQEAIPMLERTLESTSLKDGGRMMVLFELGSLREKVGEYRLAWQAIEAANNLQPGIFDPKACIEETDHIIETFSADLLARAPRATDTDELPILIVGMPRSGTSLVEQILAAHPDVSAAGELSDLQAAAVLGARSAGRQFPQWVPDISAQLATQLGEWYLNRRRSGHPGSRRVTDKMPQNFQMVGLATLILPGAHIIACERQPQDVAVSCYFQNFKAPLAWSKRLDWMRVYIDQKRRLMAHWDTVLPNQVHHVHYEDLVADPEVQRRSLVSAAGLPWHDAVAQHHSQDRKIHTASYAQATKPIYRSSVDRSAAYAEFLAPHFADLERA